MRVAIPAPLHDAALVNLAAAGFLLLSLACAVFAPELFWPLLVATAASSVIFLAFRFTPAFTAAWLLVTAASLEMTAADLIGHDAFQPTIAVVKGLGIGLAIVAALRYGPRLDKFNPAFAWLAMFVGGLAHGLRPGLTPLDSLRSLVGSVAPFAFGFSNLSRRWCQAIIRAACWAPLTSVAGGAMLDAAGLRPLFVNSGGYRLAGLGHPAFLASICQTAVYACLIEMYRHGRRRDFLLAGANLLLLLLTGARAPLSYALAVCGLSLVLVRSPAFAPRHRLLLFLACATALPVAAALVLGLVPTDLGAMRAFHVLTTDLGNLSGRQLLWPDFERAAAESPWLGWGVGAGNVIIPPGDPVVALLQTWAAHNEYLRVAVEGGQLGRALLVAMMLLWVRQHTAPLCRSDRTIMRLVFIAFAAHAVTDNLLISTPACVLFGFAVAVFARGRFEAQDGHGNAPAGAAAFIAERAAAQGRQGAMRLAGRRGTTILRGLRASGR
ncbi:MAG TPA: O-antigen ligase family protein [Acetobacteraceae bacterium]|nr:O-antigen ligase family protein [Acetobacteraceae bacterium]